MPDLRAQLAEALRDQYLLERELGRGGMATVFLARDLKHKRSVALKVLHPELAALLGPERFQREIELAARLQHPHILTVHDSGRIAASPGATEQLWFTMPYIEGESLRDRLRRERQLGVDDALRIARETASALDYAHRHGVIHRDIKPENILLTAEGHTFLSDFGIARAVDGDEHLTQTGISLGTPSYMSPEQAVAEKTLDGRTDVYSLAAVLYELLAGEPPYTGPTAQAIIAKRLTEPVPNLRNVRPNVPEAVSGAITRALARVPADRFATAAQFAQALQLPPAASTPSSRLSITAMVLGLGFVIGLGVRFAWRHTHAGASERAGTRVLAVLPFENLGDSADAYFADGVTEEVRGKLSRLAGLEVIARTSSDEYQRTSKRPQEIARELGADYLLTATVRWEKTGAGASRVRVTPELVDVGPGHTPRTRWQEPFDASLTDVFQVQAEIAGKVADALDLALGDSARRALAARPTESLAAYDAFLKGEAASQGMGVSDPPSLRRAIEFYHQAVALDSSFVPAWAQLARARSYLYFHHIPTPELAAAAREAAERARALGPDLPEGCLALGDFYQNVEEDNRHALAVVEPCLKLTPNNVDLILKTAQIETRLGQWDAAYQHLAKAGALDPRSVGTAQSTGFTLLYLRRYEEARKEMNRALALSPSNLAVIVRRAMVSLAQGDLAGAQSDLHAALGTVEPAALLAYVGNFLDLYWVLNDSEQRQLLELPPGAFDNDRATWAIVRAQVHALRGNEALARTFADSARLAIQEQLRATPGDAQRHVFLGLSLALLGRKTEAVAEGKRGVALDPISRDAYTGAYLQHQLMRIYLLIGEPERALDILESLLGIPYHLSPGWLRIDPTFAPLRGNPRFERLVHPTDR